MAYRIVFVLFLATLAPPETLAEGWHFSVPALPPSVLHPILREAEKATQKKIDGLIIDLNSVHGPKRDIAFRGLERLLVDAPTLTATALNKGLVAAENENNVHMNRALSHLLEFPKYDLFSTLNNMWAIAKSHPTIARDGVIAAELDNRVKNGRFDRVVGNLRAAQERLAKIRPQPLASDEELAKLQREFEEESTLVKSLQDGIRAAMARTIRDRGFHIVKDLSANRDEFLRVIALRDERYYQIDLHPSGASVHSMTKTSKGFEPDRIEIPVKDLFSPQALAAMKAGANPAPFRISYDAVGPRPPPPPLTPQGSPFHTRMEQDFADTAVTWFHSVSPIDQATGHDLIGRFRAQFRAAPGSLGPPDYNDIPLYPVVPPR